MIPINLNRIAIASWSNEESRRLYAAKWPDEPALRTACENGEKQCGGCSFFAAFNSDWGLCAHAQSRHHLETVSEHFACPAFVNEGWGPHGFTVDPDFHCRCGGRGSEYWDKIAAMFNESDVGGAR